MNQFYIGLGVGGMFASGNEFDKALSLLIAVCGVAWLIKKNRA